MAKITTRAGLNVGTELTIDEAARTFTLNVAGNLVAKDGVTIQALYGKFVDLWNTAPYQDSPFVMYTIDALSGQFQFGTDGSSFSGWKPANDATRQMLRDGGWDEFSAAGVRQRQYAGIVGLGGVSAGAQLYYQRALAGSPLNFTFTDQANQGIQVLGDATNGNFDDRTFFKGYVREQGKKYKSSVLADTGKTGTGAYIVNLLLSNEDDLKITANDAAMTGAPYNGITVEFFATNQNRLIGGVNYPFRKIIQANGATLAQVYTKIQFLLRQATDIDSGVGSVIGKTADELLFFTGDTLETTQGVYIDGVSAAESNSVVFRDQNNVTRVNPFQSAGVITANAPLIGAGSSYRLFFTDPPGAGNAFGELGAITVNDAAAAPITGTIASGSIAFTYDYDGNVQGGFAAGTDRPVTLIGIRPGTGKYVAATGMLTRSKSIILSLVAESDRAYI